MEEIDLKELIDMFLRRKFLIAFVIIVFAAMGAIYTLKFIVPKYESTTSLILVQVGSEVTSSIEETNSITSADLALNSKLVDNYRVICTSKTVLSKVIENLNLGYSYERLLSNVTVSTKADTELITITVQDENNEKACRIANEIASVFVDKIEDLYNVKNIHVLDRAEVKNTPCNINLSKNVIVFAFVGAILVFAYILLVNMLDTTIKSDTDIEKATGLPVLASIVMTDDSSTKSNLSTIKKRQPKKEAPIRTENSNSTSNAGSGTISMFSYLNNEDEEENSESKKSE